MTNLNVNRPPLGGLPPVNHSKSLDEANGNSPTDTSASIKQFLTTSSKPEARTSSLVNARDLEGRKASGIENKNHTQSNVETMKASAPMVAAPEDRFNNVNTPIEERRKLFKEALSGPGNFDFSTCNLKGLEREADQAVWDLTEKFISAYKEDPYSDETEELQQSLQDLYKNPTLSGQSKDIIEKCTVLLGMTEGTDYENVLPEVDAGLEHFEQNREDYYPQYTNIRNGMRLHQQTVDVIERNRAAKKEEEIELLLAMKDAGVEINMKNGSIPEQQGIRLEAEAFEKGIAKEFPEAFSDERLSHPKYAKQLKNAISEAFDAKIEIRHLEADIRRLQRGDAMLRDESQVQAMRNKLLAKKWQNFKEEQTLKELNNIPETLAKNTAKLEEAKKQLETAKLAVPKKMQAVEEIIQKGPDPNDRLTATF